MIKRSFVFVLVMVLAGSCVLAGPAQDILSNLAESARTERMVSGWTSIGIGTAIGVGGFLLLDDVELGTYAAIAGGLVALPGLITLVIPSEPEIACSKSCDSEIDSAMALEQMAANAKLERYISGVINIAAGTASLLFPYNYVTQYDYVYSAIVSFGMGAIDFLLPSKAERAYRSYELLAAPAG
ncbi:hypothetical protein KAJ02_06770 [Candidatus Bipolaricaulota bacterium]|nr:hypothetical protein [Candidatus Bipolaricaulota bacterium]